MGIVLFKIVTKDYPFYNASLFDFKYKHIVNKEYEKFWKKQPKFIIKDEQLGTLNFITEGLICEEMSDIIK